MSPIFEIQFFLIIIILSNYALSNREQYNIEKLDEFSIIKPTWNIKDKYIYYFDIEQYNLDDENIIQIINEDPAAVNNLSMFELNENFIIDNNSDINETKENATKKNIKFRLKPKKYYYEILIKKKKENQKYYVLLIETTRLLKNNSDFELTVSSKIPKINIQKSDITENKYLSQTYKMDARIEKLIKFNISNIPLENNNLILFVLDQGVSSFYLKNLAGANKRTTSLYIYEKNSTQENNFIIYLSLLGQVNETTFQIFLDNHDLVYSYTGSRKDVSYYIERLNCTNDFYIFETYFDVNDTIISEIFYTDIIPMYGDYDLYYFDFYSNNITNIFNMEYNETHKIEGTKPVNSDLCGMKLTCKNPTFIRIKYLQKKINLNISEGKEITFTMDYKIHRNNFIFLNDVNKEYKYYMGLYQLPDNGTYKASFKANKNFQPNVYYNTYFEIETKSNKIEEFRKLYCTKEKDDTFQYSIENWNDKINLKIFLISNQYYKNILEGVTKINSNEKNIAFRISKDIPFDYFTFKAYTSNLTYLFAINYEIKIVESKYIEKDKVMQGINAFKYFQKKEVNMRFSNPYNKFNSRIKQDDFVYLLVEFIMKDIYFPIYIDIRYIYNDKIIPINQIIPQIITEKNEYKIYGNKDNEKVENILININKCNNLNNYTIKTYYENENNLVFEEKITNQRTILFHKNLFNDSKIIIYSNNTENNDNKKYQQESYYTNGDIYMNYFSLKNEYANYIEVNEDYSILYEDINENETSFKWKPYLLNHQREFPVNYSIYIFPQDSPINSICQMSLIPPNISLINEVNYTIYLEKGKYKISIVASVVDDNYPLTTFYDFMNFEVPSRINIKLIIILSVSAAVLIIGIIIFIYCFKKKKKKDEYDKIKDVRKSRLLSALGFDQTNEREGIIFNEEDEDEDNLNNEYINQEENNNSKENSKIKEDESYLKCIDEKDNNNNFSISSE